MRERFGVFYASVNGTLISYKKHFAWPWYSSWDRRPGYESQHSTIPLFIHCVGGKTPAPILTPPSLALSVCIHVLVLIIRTKLGGNMHGGIVMLLFIVRSSDIWLSIWSTLCFNGFCHFGYSSMRSLSMPIYSVNFNGSVTHTTAGLECRADCLGHGP